MAPRGDQEKKKSPGWSSISKSEMAELSLLRMLSSVKGCPLYLYNDIVKWAKDCLTASRSGEGGCDIDEDNDIISMLRTREVCLPHFEVMSHAESMKPFTEESFQLHHSSGTVPLTKVPFLGSLYNVLTDLDLNQDENILLNGVTPYSEPDPYPDFINDINTGSRYISSYQALKEDDIDFPLPVIPFIDGSNLDFGDRLKTEMIAYTLVIFNRKTRYKPGAWRSMGSIPNFKRVDHHGARKRTRAS